MRDTKHLGKHANKLAEEAKEKALFRTQRKAVEAGAHGTLDYTIKEGVNKNKIADDKILKDSPQPQRSVSLGFLNTNVEESSSFL